MTTGMKERKHRRDSLREKMTTGMKERKHRRDSLREKMTTGMIERKQRQTERKVDNRNEREET